MDIISLPVFDENHRQLQASVQHLCDHRLFPLGGTELEDIHSSAVEYVALLGQEGLFDPALGRALEGEAPRPDLRSLCVVRSLLGKTSGLCDGVYGAQVQGLYPIALCGNEDQRAIFLPSMAAGQKLVSLALLDGSDPLIVSARGDDYVLSGNKALVPMAPIADQVVVLARHVGDGPPRYSLFIVDATAVQIEPEAFVSPMPVGTVSFADVALESDARLGGEGQGLIIAQAALDMLRLPSAAACLGLARQALARGVETLNARGVGGRALREQQGAMWSLANVATQVEAAEALVANAAFRRDTSSSRESKGTTMARLLAQEAAEATCVQIADLVGIRGLAASEPWMRLLAEVRALRLESELLENPRSVIAQSLLATVDADARRSSTLPSP